MRRFVALLSLLSVCGLASPTTAAVVIDYDDTFAQVSNGSTLSNTSDQFNTGGTTASVGIPGYSSTTTSNFSTPGNSATFSGMFVQSRGGDLNGFSYGSLYVAFSTDVDVPYTASGSYLNSSGYTRLFSRLYDFTADSYPYSSFQDSIGVPAEFNLGGASGNNSNLFQGSLTGTLLAGHNYIWSGETYTQAYLNSDLGAEAGGNVSLTIGVVPEASSMIVWSLLALTIAGASWWKRLKLAV